jgi:HlyD family secretion protein
LPFAVSLFSACAAPAPLAVGYVEGDYVQLAPIEVAQVETVSVRRGDRVEAGTPVVTLESGDARIAVTQAEAALAQAEAQLADLKVGKRPEEIAALEATVRSAKAQSDEASRVLVRTQDLFKRGIATQAQMDEAKTQVEVSQAAIGLAEANLKRCRPAGARRRDQGRRQAGRAGAIRTRPGPVAAVQAHVDSTCGRPHRRRHPQCRRHRRPIIPGGFGAAGRRRQAQRFHPRNGLFLGQGRHPLAVRCDGCADGLTAKVSYVSPDPEFTPPVIYSLENRQKLVYLVEARPEDANSALQPGQIVDVALEKGAGE